MGIESKDTSPVATVANTKPALNVAICGAGIGGLALALALNLHDIPCTIYEAADSVDRVLGGSLQFGPNGQYVLDKCGMLGCLSRDALFYETVKLFNANGDVIKEVAVGNKDAFGYSCIRIVRRDLVRELAARVEWQGTKIVFRKRFSRIVSSSSKPQVEFEFADGSRETASLLIGADGIHSKVRRSIFPEALPSYIGSLGIGGSVPAADVAKSITSSDLDKFRPDGLYVGPRSTCVVMPHRPDRSEYLIAIQRSYQDLGREGWDRLKQSEQDITQFIVQDRDDFPQVVRDAVDGFKSETAWIWPIHDLADLEQWTSDDYSVALIGDAAHAMPPSSGQGANMALEDGYLLALALSQMSGKVDVRDALQVWQGVRKKRIVAIKEYNTLLATWRTPKATGSAHAGESSESANGDDTAEQVRWIYEGMLAQKREINEWGCS